jgi:hypothetical protein
MAALDLLSWLCYLHSFIMAQDKASNSNLKIEALVFTRLVLASHSPAVFHPHIKVRCVRVYL